jgi:hypothetical protein
MTYIEIGLNLFLAALLIAALAYGVRLDRKLKAIRDGQKAFAEAAAELDVAAERARAGLRDLNEAASEATDLLGGRIARAREAADRLDGLIGRAETAPARTRGPEGGLSALLEDLKSAERDAPPPRAPVRAARNLIDEDLFEDLGARP